MDDEQKIWELACERVGLWKRGVIIRREDDDGYGAEQTAPPFDPGTAFAMLLWMRHYCDSIQWRRACDNIRFAFNDADAFLTIARAVLATREALA